MSSVAPLVIANYLRIASEYLAGSRALAALGNRNAVYLGEQAAEKMIRAVLTSEGLHGGIKHQLDAMVDLLPDANPMKAALREVEELSSYATTFRYPTPGGRIPAAPSASELEAYLVRLQEILTQLASRFGVDVARAGTPAVTPEPIR